MPLVNLRKQIGYSRAEDALVSLQGLHRRHHVIGSVGLKNPPANTRFQTVLDHLLGVHGGKDQYGLGGIVFQDLPCRVHAI